jgi:hypothetical protein
VRHKDFARLIDVAARCGGICTAGQAGELGISRRQLSDAVAMGLLARLHPGIYWIGAGSPPAAARIHAAVAAVGSTAVASHESALFLAGIDGVPFHPAVTVPPGGRANQAGIRVHRFGDLAPSHRRVVGGIPTTTLERAMVDIVSVVSTSRAEWLFDRLTIVERRTTPARIARTFRQCNRRGRPRVGTLVALLGAHQPGVAVPRSSLERRVDGLILRSGLPSPAHEHPLPTDGRPEGCVDRAWIDARIILEIDGRPWHARERDMARDRRRDRMAAAQGWVVLRVLDEEVASLPDEVIADLAAVLRERTSAQRPTE